MMDKVQKLVGNAETYLEYQKWIKHPITELVFEAMLEMIMAESAQPIKMVGSQGVSIEINALEGARIKGMCECMARQVSFGNNQQQEMPPEDYNEPTLSVQPGGKQ